MTRMTGLIVMLLILLVVVGGMVFAWRNLQRGVQTLTQPGRGPDAPFPADAGVAWEEVTLENSGLSLGAWFVPPSEVADGAVLVYVHGFGGNRRAWLNEALAIHAQTGVGALLLDLRNSGVSDGAVTTWGYDEASDVQTAVSYLQSRDDVNPKRIGIVGKSMGGGAAARAAAQIPNEVQVLILQSTFSGVDDNWLAITTKVVGLAEVYERPFAWWAEQQTGVPFSQIRTREDVVAYDGPLLVMHGVQDDIIAVEQGQKLFAVASEPKAYYEVAEAGHGNVFWSDQAAYVETIASFLRTHLLPEG